MSAADMFWAAPPVARTITAAAVLLSVPTHMQLLNIYYMIFHPSLVFTLQTVPQLWRLVVPFFITGPRESMLMDPYFLFTLSRDLETGGVRFSEPGSFLVYLVFCGIIIIFTAGCWLDARLFLSPLTLALAYTFAQENSNRPMTFFIVTFSAKWLPFAMLALSFVLSGPQAALVQSTGLLAAHAYEFLTKIWPEHGGGQQWIKTPAVVRGWFQQSPNAGQQRSGYQVFQGRSSGTVGGQSSSSGPNPAGGSFTTGFNAGNYGTGRRLGGE
ncbi:DER1-domain-containing protein [Polychaeton citri CBS 116435]|uniref:Derlin n=1 Tax=Polychaeton citri CBS 116435 TaxID=1314669 RepID=A0A9P4Q6T3_9PEZI|nr:DER1-domain-containing protein [Polychaeton citri CBS 116435]